MDFFISDWLGIVLFHHLPFHTLAHKMQHQQSKFSSLFYHFETVCPSGLSAAPGPDSGWNWKYCRESVISELYWNCFMYSNSIPGCHDEWMKRWVHNNTSGTTSRGWGGEGEVGGENAGQSDGRVQVSFSPQSSSPHSIHLLFFLLLLLLHEDNSSTRELSLPCAHEMMMMRGGGWEM